MKTSEQNTSVTEAGRRAGYVPKVSADSTIEELDEWIIALGGRELSDSEVDRLVAEVKWADVPGENPGEEGFPFAPQAVAL